MKAAWLALVAVGCAAPNVGVESAPRAPSPVPAAVTPPPGIPIDQVGSDAHVDDWIDLAMPDGARVFVSSSEYMSPGTETWKLFESGTRRVLRIRAEGGGEIATAAYAGEAMGGHLALHLVELEGDLSFAPERIKVTCTAETACTKDRPHIRVHGRLCTAENVDGTNAVASIWFGPANAASLSLVACPNVAPSPARMQMMKRPRMNEARGF